ncbi:NRDE family protein [Wenzhouxiangella sp. AB-CW3]|uniref:NRDE family protein n=1 Tax=Wenzhouxiangella sp. AB-CW3 TaxID=2771012 RepID=UPI00168A8863|nr:NRDE family protein [Wenzhouxiangella sp. AB-CW3]QOC23271.1 NRDE family protein [Wenzhouxiangella sp. AB-CW3]
MCLITFAFTPHQPRHLLLAANRDEFHERPTRPMAWWDWPVGPLAGRDEQAGGTWLAVGRDGRWAAVTNFRDPRGKSGQRSRGELPTDFIRGNGSPADYVHAVYRRRGDYGPFNLLAGDRGTLWYCSTHAGPTAVGPGIHALSNGLLDEPWPKSRRVATALEGLPSSAEIDAKRLFGLMQDRATAPDDELPDTGVGDELERFLSSPFIVGERYGTRCTTVLALQSRCLVAERSYAAAGQPSGELRYEFTLRT